MRREHKTKKSVLPVAPSWLIGLAVVIAAFLLVVLFSKTNAYAFRHLVRAPRAFGIACTILGAGTLLGLFLVRRTRLAPEGCIDELLVSFGIGNGLLSLATLGLGLMGGVSIFVFAPALVLCILVGIRPLRAWIAKLRRQSIAEKRLAPFYALLVALAAFVALWMLLNSFTETYEFDSLEYHLGAPARYAHLGRITFLDGNVYSNFPFGVEMLYLHGLVLSGNLMEGVYVAKLINLMFALMGALATYALGRKVADARIGFVAAVLFLTAPWVYDTTAVGVYVTMGWTFYTTLAIYAIYVYVSENPANRTRRWLILGGLAAGFAVGAKYPGVVFVVIPLAVVVGAAMWHAAKSFKTALTAAVLFVCLAVAACAPWFVKNLVYTGNPVYPLMYDTFKGQQWDDFKNARWEQHHNRPNKTVGAALLGTVANDLTAPAIVAFFPFLIIALKSGRRWGPLLAYGFVYAALWVLLTHRIERFLVPVLPVAAVLGAIGFCSLEGSRLRRYAQAGLVVLLLLSFFLSYARQEEADAARFADHYLKDMIDYVNGMPKDTRVLAVGEARNYYFRPEFITYTVWDGNPLDKFAAERGSSGELRDYLARERFTHILVNWIEIDRYNRTYEFRHEGIVHRGFSDFITPRYFDDLEAGNILVRETHFGSERNGLYAAQLYKVHEEGPTP